MVKIIQIHVRLLIIILVGISIILLFHTIPVEALESNPPQSPSPNDTKGGQMIPFYWVIAIVGGCIALTLTYVSWKKYNAEEKEEENTEATNEQTKEDSNS